MAYMDDVLVFAETLEHQLEHLGITFNCMRERALTVNPGEVQLLLSRLKLLGYVIPSLQDSTK